MRVSLRRANGFASTGVPLPVVTIARKKCGGAVAEPVRDCVFDRTAFKKALRLIQVAMLFSVTAALVDAQRRPGIAPISVGNPTGTLPAASSAPVISKVANAEGESPTIAPNTWVEIKGTSLAPAGDTRTWQESDFANGNMPGQLDG